MMDSITTPDVPSVAELRAGVREWLKDNDDRLRQRRDPSRSLATEMDYNGWLYDELWQRGFSRWGWPTVAAGRPGSAMLRAIVSEELTFARAIHPNIFFMPEILGRAFADFASDTLVQRHLEPYLRGVEWWCQGFSEPESGSDLASLSTKAKQHGDTLVINGQKVWTSLGQFAKRCLLLVRTGTAEAAHRGITALLVDMASAGVTVRPLRGMHGEDEYSEVFFSDVEVPVDNVVGEIGGGWAVAMRALQYERATIFWTRAAWLHDRLAALIEDVGASNASPALVGNTFQLVATLRAVSRQTQYELEAGTFSAPSSSVDKTLMALSEQTLFDSVRELLGERLLFADDPVAQGWRTEFLYSRAASIYGGTGEIQRNIIGERLLGLPREPKV